MNRCLRFCFLSSQITHRTSVESFDRSGAVAMTSTGGHDRGALLRHEPKGSRPVPPHAAKISRQRRQRRCCAHRARFVLSGRRLAAIFLMLNRTLTAAGAETIPRRRQLFHSQLVASIDRIATALTEGMCRFPVPSPMQNPQATDYVGSPWFPRYTAQSSISSRRFSKRSLLR